MTNSTQMNEIIEERRQLCKYLYLIKKETDKRNKEKRERGVKKLVYIDIFAIPSHLKILFGGFIKNSTIHRNNHSGRGTYFISCELYYSSREQNVLWGWSDGGYLRSEHRNV